MSTGVQEFAMRFGQAWAAHEADAIVAMHTDDSVFHQHGYVDAITGCGDVRAAIAAGFVLTPDLAFAVSRAHFGEQPFVTEYVMSGAAGGRAFAGDGVDVFTLRDGRIARKDTYIDWLGLQRQTGIDLAAAAGGRRVPGTGPGRKLQGGPSMRPRAAAEHHQGHAHLSLPTGTAPSRPDAAHPIADARPRHRVGGNGRAHGLPDR